MSEVDSSHPLSYRQEIAVPLFRLIRARESIAIVGCSSMGKSNLLKYILRPEVRQYYLGKENTVILFATVDCNRLARVSSWGIYEMMLTAFTEACGQSPATLPLRSVINSLRDDTITDRDRLLAWRHLELATQILCQEHGRVLCVILDEFDEAYRTLPAQTLRHLRALRDANKYQICYLLFLRDHPGRLRATGEIEGFYELLSRSVLGLGPYSQPDAERVLHQLEARHERSLTSLTRSQILYLTGGHPGLMLTVFAALPSTVPDEWDWEAWAAKQPTIWEECQKLWDGLAEDERQGLIDLTKGLTAPMNLQASLALKGLILDASTPVRLFSPIFTRFVLEQGEPELAPLQLDLTAQVVWRGSRPITNLTAREFDLLAFLYNRAGQICTRQQISASLYPDEMLDRVAISKDKRVDTLVKRMREKIEPSHEHPRYVVTVRGKGYKLISHPKTK